MRSYTPLRYPGGKTKLYPYVKSLIESNFEYPPVYIEGFAGGAGLALKLLSTGVVSEIYINDYDYAVHCIWFALKHNNRQFIELIKSAEFTIEEWKRQKEIYLMSIDRKQHSKLEVGFATFYLNRTNRSGIIMAGPIGGKKQDGNYKMDCRFNKTELIKIVKNFNKLKSKIFIYNRDAHRFVNTIDTKLIDSEVEALFYLDPPYVQRGPQLYKNSFDEIKHVELRDAISKLKSKWFVTYDNDPLIEAIYDDFSKHTFELSYVMQTAKVGTELAIFSKNIIEHSKINLKNGLTNPCST